MVLAAGAGSRYGGPTHKLLAPVGGRPLVAVVVEAALGAGLDETVVVTGAVDLTDVLPPGVTVLHHPGWAAGQAGSLGVAVDHARAAGHDAVIVGLGDQPGVPTSAWRAVAAATGHPIVAADYGSGRRNPVRLHRSVWDELPRTGDEGARPLLLRRPELVGTVTCRGDPADVDRVEDLAPWS